jgi:hypothetical protein
MITGVPDRGASMQAIRVHHFGGPESLVSEEVPRPEPGEGEVLLRVKAGGVGRRPIFYTTKVDGMGSLFKPFSDTALLEALNTALRMRWP